MFKKEEVKNKTNGNNNHLPYHQNLTSGQRAADKLTAFGGSWVFILMFLSVLVLWAVTNTLLLREKPFDPFPFILLNLFLSMLAALQAPIILMSQNRVAERDRVQAKYDYQVNRKAEREIQEVQKELKRTQQMIARLSKYNSSSK